MSTQVTEDSQAVLLLCSTLALPRSEGAPKPLSRTEWNDLARAIRASSLERPGALLTASQADVSKELALPPLLSQRIRLLLERGAQLAIERERLASRGIWTLTRADERYPSKLKERLRALAPPVLFGAGPIEAINRDSVAVVGSRDVDDAGAAFASALGQLCAESELSVVSGAARGVDRIAMDAALEHGGSAVAVLADSLEESLKRRDTRDRVLTGRLTLFTPSHPSAKFSVAAAMGRNKLIYAVASWAVVVSSALETGGTWAGATENLSAGWVPLFVRAGEGVPEGNCALIDKGAIPLLLSDVSESLPLRLAHASQRPDSTPDVVSLLVKESTPSFGIPHAQPCSERSVGDIFTLAWPQIASYLSEPRTLDEVMAAFVLERAQVKAWLERAVADGKVIKLKRPARFQAVADAAAPGNLF
jgi:predicted Rossmann fold nucleotide-binding protein DprA/Smf involved in DNA uptake